MKLMYNNIKIEQYLKSEEANNVKKKMIIKVKKKIDQWQKLLESSQTKVVGGMVDKDVQEIPNEIRSSLVEQNEEMNSKIDRHNNLGESTLYKGQKKSGNSIEETSVL